MNRMVGVLLLVLTLVATAKAQPDSALTQRLTEFEHWLEAAIDSNEFVGITLAFEVDGYQWSKGYGLADRENELPATRESSYRLASVSKPVTAVGVLKLVEAGKINLDDEVQVYVPEFPRKEWPVTIRHLLRHTSGISHYKDYQAEAVHTRQMSTEEALAVFQDWDLVFEPGTRYGYTTYGFNLLGAVIEGATGRPFCEYMTAEVWQPLGMTETYCDNPGDPIPHRVKGYVRRDGEIVPSTVVNTSMKYGGGGMRSIAADMVRFAQGVSDGKILSKMWVDSMWLSGVTSEGRFTRYGYGWSTSSFHGHFLVMHGGAQEETRTSLLHLPIADVTVMGMSNFESSSPREPAMRLLAVLLDEEYPVPEPYTGDPVDDVRYAALRWCFNDGFSEWERLGGRPVAMTDADRAMAFNYVKSLLVKEADEIPLEVLHQKLSDGRHPSAGRPFAKVGSFVVDVMRQKKGSAYIKAAHGRGVLALYADFSELASITFGLDRIDPGVEAMIRDWNRSWTKAWNDDVQNLEFGPRMDIDGTKVILRRISRNQPVYPDFTGDLQDACLASLQENRKLFAHEVALIGVDIYPNSDVANRTMGFCRIVQGDTDEGREYLSRAIELDSEGAASAGGLNGMAYRLAGWEQYKPALEVLSVAIELYPDEANLVDSKAEMYLTQGDLVNARTWYEKAAAMDPEFESPRRMLERIDQMEAEQTAGDQ